MSESIINTTTTNIINDFLHYGEYEEEKKNVKKYLVKVIKDNLNDFIDNYYKKSLLFYSSNIDIIQENAKLKQELNDNKIRLIDSLQKLNNLDKEIQNLKKINEELTKDNDNYSKIIKEEQKKVLKLEDDIKNNHIHKDILEKDYISNNNLKRLKNLLKYLSEDIDNSMTSAKMSMNMLLEDVRLYCDNKKLENNENSSDKDLHVEESYSDESESDGNSESD
jgi:hypothetical protein